MIKRRSIPDVNNSSTQAQAQMKIVHLLYAAPACEAGADGSVSMATGGSTASSKGSLVITQISTVSFVSMEKWMF